MGTTKSTTPQAKTTAKRAQGDTKTATTDNGLHQAVEQATSAREAAEKALETARQNVKAAGDHTGDLKAKLGDGDATVTAADLSEAQFEQERAGMLAEAAEVELKKVGRAEQAAIAAMVATRILEGEGSRQQQDAEVRKQARAIQAAIQGLLAAVSNRNESIAKSVAEAQAAGLTEGDVYVSSRRKLGYDTVRETLLTVHDDEVVANDPQRVLAEVLAESFHSIAVKGLELPEVVSSSQPPWRRTPGGHKDGTWLGDE